MVRSVQSEWIEIDKKHPGISGRKSAGLLARHGLGGGESFHRVVLDEEDLVWVMLHSGSRNIAIAWALIFIERAKNALKNTKTRRQGACLAFRGHRRLR